MPPRRLRSLLGWLDTRARCLPAWGTVVTFPGEAAQTEVTTAPVGLVDGQDVGRSVKALGTDIGQDHNKAYLGAAAIVTACAPDHGSAR